MTAPTSIQGGTGVDTLNGGAGGDRILGNPGNDIMNGNAGDDTLVWNNGDGNDQMNGDDGLDRIENNLGAADDVSQLNVVDGKVRYARVNAPFTLDVATSEVFELNTFGGNDTLDGPRPRRADRRRGRRRLGNDRFTGGDESDTFFGGLGDDTLDPGAGAATRSTGRTATTLNVRDNAPTSPVAAPAGPAEADPADVLVDVETRDVAPGPTRRAPPRACSTAGSPRSSRRASTPRRSGSSARPPRPAAAQGTLVLQTAPQVRRRHEVQRRRGRLKRYTLDAAESKTLKVKLPKGVRALSRTAVHAVPERDHDEPRRGGQPRPALRGSRSS